MAAAGEGRDAAQRQPVDAVPTALALDRTSDVIAVGLASGQLQLMPAAREPGAHRSSFFGHRGRVTAAALNGGRGLAATGGNDGIVRVWDVASGRRRVPSRSRAMRRWRSSR